MDNELDPDVEQALDAEIKKYSGYSTPSAEPAPQVGLVKSQLEQQLADSLRSATGAVPAGGVTAMDATPGWYKPLQSGPPKQGTGAAMASAGLGALAQGAQKQADLSAREPLRTYGNKVMDQRSAMGAGIAAAGLGALLNKPQADYAATQEAALKDAQMKHLARSGAGNNASQVLGALNYMSSDERRGQIAEKERTEMQAKLDSMDPNSKRSEAARVAAVQVGGFTPEMVAGKSEKQLLDMKTAALQARGNEYHQENFDYETGVKQAAAANEKNIDQQIKARGEERETERVKAQAYIPGVQWAGGNPPPPATVEKVRPLVAAYSTIDRGATELEQIQRRLEEKGVIGAVGGQWKPIQAISDPEDRKALQRAKNLQRDMVNAYRARSEYGALTGREQELADEMNARAGSPEAFFIGPEVFQALKEDNRALTREKLNSYGAAFEGEPVPGNAPKVTPPSQNTVQVQAAVPVRKGQAAPSVQLPTVGGAPAGAPDAEAAGVFTVTLPSKRTLTRPMSKEEYDNAVKLGMKPVPAKL